MIDYSSNTCLALSALSLGFASVVYVFYGPKQSSTKRSRLNGVNGLNNYGNQCFINAILQSLSSSKSMNLWLNYANDLLHNHCHSLTHSLLDTINGLNNESVGYHSYESSYSSDNVLNALRAHKWTISNEEQDAFELFNVLTATLESELYSSLPLYSLKDALLVEGRISGVSPETSPTIHTRVSHQEVCGDNRIVKPLPTKGLLCSQVYCRKCSHKYALHLDTFDAISLSIPNNMYGIPIQLQDCLKKFVSNEIIHEVRCESCITNSHRLDANRRSAFVKRLTFAKMPQLLCLHIHRLVWLNDGQPMKRFERIIFPEYLVMDSFVYNSHKSSIDLNSSITLGLIGGASASVDQAFDCTQPLPTTNTSLPTTKSVGDGDKQIYSIDESVVKAKYRYKLCSVIVHLGGASSGHFVCYRRGANIHNHMKWYYISDATVLEVSLSEVLNSSAYMLYYERISKH